MSQETNAMELRVSTSHLTQDSDSITLRAETGKRPGSASAGNYITCIASDEMKISGSGELNSDDKRVSWSKFKDNAHISNKDNKTEVEIIQDENHMELESINETTSNTKPSTAEGVDVEMLDSTNNQMEHNFSRVDTPPLSSRTPTTTRNKDGSKGSGMIMRQSGGGGVELEDIMLQAREGIGGNRLSKQALKVSAILHHAPQPPSSPPHLPLNLDGDSDDTNTKAVKNEEEVRLDSSIISSEDEMEEIVVEVEEISNQYAGIEGYNSSEKGHVVEIEVEGQEGVGMGIAEPKQDRMVRKEIVRVVVVALIALIVVLVFVFT